MMFMIRRTIPFNRTSNIRNMTEATPSSQPVQRSHEVLTSICKCNPALPLEPLDACYVLQLVSPRIDHLATSTMWRYILNL